MLTADFYFVNVARKYIMGNFELSFKCVVIRLYYTPPSYSSVCTAGTHIDKKYYVSM